MESLYMLAGPIQLPDETNGVLCFRLNLFPLIKRFLCTPVAKVLIRRPQGGVG